MRFHRKHIEYQNLNFKKELFLKQSFSHKIVLKIVSKCVHEKELLKKVEKIYIL